MQQFFSAEWLNAVAITWSEASSVPAEVGVEQVGRKLQFSVSGRFLTLDLNNGEAEFSEKWANNSGMK